MQMNLPRFLLTVVLALHWTPYLSLAEPATAATNSEPSLEALLPRLKPTSPEDSLKTFRIEPGFKIELAAAEPNVSDPCAMEWDENGRLFVCELWKTDGNSSRQPMLGFARSISPTARTAACTSQRCIVK